MSRARLVITAVVVQGRPVTEVADQYGLHRAWVYKLLARYRQEGEAAFEAHSRHPKTSPKATLTATVELILKLRKDLSSQGHDAGPETIRWHLFTHHQVTVSRATIARTLTRAGLVTPEPKKKPKSAYIRFEADQPNAMWQSDFTHYRLADGTDSEIITWLDDHSRYALHISGHQRVTGAAVLATFRQAMHENGIPASTLTDNGMVYTVRLSGHGRQGGRTALENELRQLNITQKNSQPNHPTTCGKVERFKDPTYRRRAAG